MGASRGSLVSYVSNRTQSVYNEDPRPCVVVKLAVIKAFNIIKNVLILA